MDLSGTMRFLLLVGAVMTIAHAQTLQWEDSDGQVISNQEILMKAKDKAKLELSCFAGNLQRTELVIWKKEVSKKLQGSIEKVNETIATFNIIEGNFEGSRYKAGAIDEQGQDFWLAFSIDPVTKWDSADHYCVRKGSAGESAAKFTLKVEVEPEMTFSQVKDGEDHKIHEDKTFDVQEGDKLSFKAVATGSSEPNMRFKIGDVNVDQRYVAQDYRNEGERIFPEDLGEEREEDLPGSSYVIFTKTMSINQLPMEYAYNGKALKCELVEDNKVTKTSKAVTFKFPGVPPAFTACTEEVVSWKGAANVKLTCALRPGSEPTDQSYVSWQEGPQQDDANFEELPDSSKRVLKVAENDARHQLSLVEDGDHHNMTLRFVEKLETQDFREYYFYAVNNFGTAETRIGLVRDISKEGTSTAAPVDMSIFASLLAAALAALWCHL